MSYERPFRYYLLKARPPWTKTAVYGPSTRPSVLVDNGPKFVLRPSISWTSLDAGPRLSFEGGRMDIFLTMDRRLHGRIRTIKKPPDGRKWTGRRMKQTGGWTNDPLTIFGEDFIQLTVGV